MKSKKFAVVLLILFVIMIAGGFYLYSNTRVKTYELDKILTYRTVDDFIKQFDSAEYCQSIYFDEERRIVIVEANERQRKEWLNAVEKGLEILYENNGNGYDIKITEDYKTVEARLYKRNVTPEMIVRMEQFVFTSEVEQVFNGVPDWECRIVIYDKATGEVVLESDGSIEDERIEIHSNMFSE